MNKKLYELFRLLGDINESTACVIQNIGYLQEGTDKDIALSDARSAASQLVDSATALLGLLNE